jgi:hypothetical protein
MCERAIIDIGERLEDLTSLSLVRQQVLTLLSTAALQMIFKFIQ